MDAGKNDLPLPGVDAANAAAMFGHVDVLQWMRENNFPLPDQNGIDLAIQNGHLEVVEWLASQ